MRHVSCEIGDAGFGRRIAAHARHGAEGCHGREIDDAALALADNGLQENLCRYDGASEIKVQDGLELGGVKVEEILVGTDGRSLHVSSGSVEQGVNLPVSCQDVGTVLLKCFLVHDVRLIERGLASGIGDFLHDAVAHVFLASKYGHLGTLSGKILCYGATENSCSACYHYNISVDVEKILFHCLIKFLVGVNDCLLLPLVFQ